MKAAVYRAYGPPSVVEVVAGVPVPTLRTPRDVRIRVAATTVATGDVRLRAADFPYGFGTMGRLIFGITGPRGPAHGTVLGTELAGEVVEVGAAVTAFRVGDAVVAMTGATFGAHAEYCVVAEDGPIAKLAVRPRAADAPAPGADTDTEKGAQLTWDEAASLGFGGGTAYIFLHTRAHVQPGERVLVVGAAGAIGSAAVQIAHAAGAVVTGVASAGTHATVRALGATDMIDYATQDFAALGRTWDIIVDTTGTADYARVRPVLTPGTGRLALILADLPATLGALVRTGVLAGPAMPTGADMAAVVRLAEEGRFHPLIDSTFPLEQIVDAHARVDSGHKHGSVVVRVWTP